MGNSMVTTSATNIVNRNIAKPLSTSKEEAYLPLRQLFEAIFETKADITLGTDTLSQRISNRLIAMGISTKRANDIATGKEKVMKTYIDALNNFHKKKCDLLAMGVSEQRANAVALGDELIPESELKELKDKYTRKCNIETIAFAILPRKIDYKILNVIEALTEVSKNIKTEDLIVLGRTAQIIYDEESKNNVLSPKRDLFATDITNLFLLNVNKDDLNKFARIMEYLMNN